MKKHLFAAAVAAGLAGSIAGVDPAAADVFTIDDFTVIKNGSPILDDGFNDGIAPPNTSSVPAFSCTTSPNCYSTSGTFSETSGRAVLDTSLGGLLTSPVGSAVRMDNAILKSNIDPSSFLGLKQGDATHNITFSVSGRFDLGFPTADHTAYGVRLTDRLIGGPGTPPDQAGDDTLDMNVRNVGGNIRVEFRELDFQGGTTTTIAFADLPTILGTLASSSITPDQIVLTLARNNAATNDITASFSLLQAGSDVYDQTLLAPPAFATNATIFNGENWTRAAFFGYEAVPEPVSLALFGVGLAAVGFVRRRKAA